MSIQKEINLINLKFRSKIVLTKQLVDYLNNRLTVSKVY